MTTWQNVFDGYNPFSDIFSHHPDLLTQAINADALPYFLLQLLSAIGQLFLFTMYATFIIFLLVVFAAVIFRIFNPLFERAGRIL